MTWVKLDDNAPLHPKLQDAGAEAAWLWVAGLAHANRHTTNGVIKKRHAEGLYPPLARKARRLARRLVELGLWIDLNQNEYQIHDYDHYQEEALTSRVEERREAARERKRRQRERDKVRKREDYEDGHGVTPPVTSHVTDGVTTPVTGHVTPPVTHEGDNTLDSHTPPARPGPARPVKDPPYSPPKGDAPKPKRTRRKQAAPIPDDWQPTDQHRAFAAKHGLDLDLEVQAFLGHYDCQDVASPNGRFTTWLANQVRWQRGRKGAQQPAQGSQTPTGGQAPDESFEAYMRRVNAATQKAAGLA